MHELEPFYKWRDDYIASEDKKSPFFKQQYSEFAFDKQIYNYYIHPQWDYFGSPTLYLKILFTDYRRKFCVMELIGEWNDCIHNDIMFLKRYVVEWIMQHGVNKFILIGENILNFHVSDDCYYEEWFQEVDEGWIAGINFREHVISEFRSQNIDYYINFGGELDTMNWRMLQPHQLFEKVEAILSRRLTA